MIERTHTIAKSKGDGKREREREKAKLQERKRDGCLATLIPMAFPATPIDFIFSTSVHGVHESGSTGEGRGGQKGSKDRVWLAMVAAAASASGVTCWVVLILNFLGRKARTWVALWNSQTELNFQPVAILDLLSLSFDVESHIRVFVKINKISFLSSLTTWKLYIFFSLFSPLTEKKKRF